VSLVGPSIGPGPFFLVAEYGFSATLDPGSAVIVDPRERTLAIGQVCVETSGAALWNPRPAWHLLQERANRRQAQASNRLAPELERSLQQLLAGIGDGRLDDIRHGAFSLAGLGGGLTPAGDDILMGVIYGLWVWRPEREWIRLIVETAVPLTTTLSAAFLRAAGDGEATSHWHNLLSGKKSAIDQILTIGESSGRDAWAGFARLEQLFRSGCR
jgi:hypothetical protein